MSFPTREQVKMIKADYLDETKVRLLKMDDEFAPPVGTLGVVDGVDDTGSLLISWSNGSSLSVLFDIDRVERVL